MALFDRVRDTTTGTGTGNLTLANSAPTGFRTFGSVLSNNDRVYYCVAHQSANEWETGFGTYSTTGPALARTVVLASSNSGSAVNFSSGTKDVFITPPASVFGNRLPEISITSATTATIDRMHVCSGTSADYTVTLPAVTNNEGRRLWFRMAPLASLNKLITLDAGAGVTIDGRSTTLNGAINSSVTSITVASATGFPAFGNYVIQIASEQMLVTGGQGTTTWTVTRGFNGTVAASQSNGAAVDWNRTRVMWAGEDAELLCDGTNWFKLSGLTIPMRCAMNQTTGTSNSNTVDTKQNLDTTVSDPTGLMADTTNKRINIRRNSDYQISGSVYYANAAGGNLFQCFARRNGSTNIPDLIAVSVGGSSGYIRPNFAGFTILAASDNVELWGAQFSGGAMTPAASALFVQEIPTW